MSFQSIIFLLKLFFRNIVKNRISFYKLWVLSNNLLYAFLRIPRVKYGPSAMWIEGANFCNLSCEGCWVPALSKKLTPKSMDINMYKKIVDETNPTLIMIMLQMSGESFLNKNILDMMSYADKKNIVIWTSTNGSFPTPSDWGEKIVKTGIDTLYFSISGLTHEDYKRYHREGNLSLVIENIKKIQAAKKKMRSKTPYIFFRMLLTDKSNIPIREAKKFARDLGAGLHVRYIRLRYVFEGLEDPAKKKIRVSSSKGPVSITNNCLGLWIAPAVQSNGDVLPCCLNHLGVPTFGNINESTFSEIWQGDRFNEFRRKMLADKRVLNGCVYCDSSIGFKDKFAMERRVINISFYSD